MPVINPKVLMALMRSDLIALRDNLNEKIIECNEYTRSRRDFGATHRPDDTMETISFTRGKSVGLVIARDRINKLLEEYPCK